MKTCEECSYFSRKSYGLGGVCSVESSFYSDLQKERVRCQKAPSETACASFRLAIDRVKVEIQIDTSKGEKADFSKENTIIVSLMAEISKQRLAVQQFMQLYYPKCWFRENTAKNQLQLGIDHESN